MIKTKPATDDYRDNFDRIFSKKTPMKTFRIPVDIRGKFKDADDAERQASDFMRAAIRDFGATYGITTAEFPVGYPTEPEE